MSNNVNNSSSTGGIGFFGLLTILFIGLKLTHYIDWSWWWVLSPLWIGLAITLVVLVICFTIIGAAGFYDNRRFRGKR